MSWEPLMSAIVDAVLFLELSGNDIVDEDAAVGAMERMAAALRGLGPVEREQFVGYLRQRAIDGESCTPPERECIRTMADNLGLTGE